jgi:magnesium transporter
LIRTMSITDRNEVLIDIPVTRIQDKHIKWYWVDFESPSEQEIALLTEHFHFHPLAIEDCLHHIQRPKLDHYDNCHFFVLHALHENNLTVEEVDLFLGNNFIVSYHQKPQREIENAWQRIMEQTKLFEQGPIYAAYLIMDQLVDEYFPSVYQLEERLAEIEMNTSGTSLEKIMNQVFETRSKLLKVRRTIVPMRELLYRVINSQRIEGLEHNHAYFADIHDHLLKLSEIVESNREISSDMRDSYISINSNRMNKIMKTLTVITTIFMPLTFLAGIYGMNFEHMPELKWPHGYFLILTFMALIGFGMFMWFQRKGWFK